MRQGFMIAAIMLWVAINILGNIAEKQALLSQPDTNVTNPQTGAAMTQEETMWELTKPNMTDTNVVTIFSKVWEYIKLIGKTITLWHPAVWHGFAVNIYLFVILPIGISFWVIFVLALRGIGSG